MTTAAKRFAWYVTITLVTGGTLFYAGFSLGLTIAWIVEHPVVIPFVAGWVLSVFVAVGMAALWGDV